MFFVYFFCLFLTVFQHTNPIGSVCVFDRINVWITKEELPLGQEGRFRIIKAKSINVSQLVTFGFVKWNVVNHL